MGQKSFFPKGSFSAIYNVYFQIVKKKKSNNNNDNNIVMMFINFLVFCFLILKIIHD